MSDRNREKAVQTEPEREEDEVTRVARQVRSQLEQRGVSVHDADAPEDEVTILEAVEAFEAAVRRCGGDSFTNTPDSSRPDRPEFVIPRRGDDERADTYARRVQTAAASLAPASADGPGHDTTV